MNKLLLAVVLCLICFVNCSTMMIGSTQKIDVYSKPEMATVKVNDMNAGVTPCTLELKRTGDYSIRLELPGYNEKTVYLERKYSGWFFCNILLGGIVGMFIDAMTGAIYVYDPKEIDVDLNSLGFKKPAKDSNLHIVVGLAPDPSWQKIAEMTPVGVK